MSKPTRDGWAFLSCADLSIIRKAALILQYGRPPMPKHHEDRDEIDIVVCGLNKINRSIRKP